MTDVTRPPAGEPSPGDTLPGIEDGESAPVDATRVAPAELDDATAALLALQQLGERGRRAAPVKGAPAPPPGEPAAAQAPPPDERAAAQAPPDEPAAAQAPLAQTRVQAPPTQPLTDETAYGEQMYAHGEVESPPSPLLVPLQGSYARRRRVSDGSRLGATIARYAAPVILLIAVLVTFSLAINAGIFGGKATVKPKPTATHTAKAKPRYYVVKQGDSLSSISLKTGVSMAKIQELNPTIDPATLHPGQRLRLTGP